jgi:hypothetical protein
MNLESLFYAAFGDFDGVLDLNGECTIRGEVLLGKVEGVQRIVACFVEPVGEAPGKLRIDRNFMLPDVPAVLRGTVAPHRQARRGCLRVPGLRSRSVSHR